jgi:alpha-glucosidase
MPVTELHKKPTDAAEYRPLEGAEVSDHDQNRLRLNAGDGPGHTTVEVTALAPDLFRVGMFPAGRPARYSSEAIAKSEWPDVEVSMRNANGSVELDTGSATASVALSPLRIGFSDAGGREFAPDADGPQGGMGTIPRPDAGPGGSPIGDPVKLHKQRKPGERYFGCGERTRGLEKTGTRLTFWNVDPPEGHTASYDNLYASIPFVMTLNEETGEAWGLLLDSTHRVHFDLAHGTDDKATFQAEGGDLIYYVFCGPTPKDVLERYTELTGHTPMPPLWSLGNQQSRWGYEGASEVQEVARQYRERDLPCDVMYFDIDYMDGFRVFTWGEESFPEPEETVSRLADDGFRVVTIVDPGVKAEEGYGVYEEGRERGFYCLTADGEELQNAVWPGVCAFPDFTSPEVRAWWGENHRALTDVGVDGIWCDMNEPSLFIPKQSTMPEDAIHPGGSTGERRYHAEVHNAYGSLMARATREGLLKLRPERRPFVITRSAYAGVQRHAMQWTGDNSSWWEHLYMTMPQLMNMGLSGVSWAGMDIGGFFDDTNGELLARWYEMGIFQPFCRNHSATWTRHQEPWLFGERYEASIRKMLKLRQRLIPYLYTLFEECHRTGAPILRPLLYEYPEDKTTYTADDEFMFGHAMLVAPITRPGEANEHRHVYLPDGSWFHYWTGERHDGPDHILAHAPLGEPPIYLKANTAVPLWPEMNHIGEKPADPLTLLIHPAEGSAAGETTLYEDAGDGFEHERGEYAWRTVSCERGEGSITVRLSEREGSFVPQREAVVLELRGITDSPASVLADGAEAEFDHDAGAAVLQVRLTEGATATTLEVDL